MFKVILIFLSLLAVPFVVDFVKFSLTPITVSKENPVSEYGVIEICACLITLPISIPATIVYLVSHITVQHFIIIPVVKFIYVLSYRRHVMKNIHVPHKCNECGEVLSEFEHFSHCPNCGMMLGEEVANDTRQTR